jgi:hypothetical protein
MAKSSSTTGRQSPATTPLYRLARGPQTLRRAHAGAHRFVEQLESELEDAVDSARSRRLAPIKHIEQAVRYLHSRYVIADQAAGTKPGSRAGSASNLASFSR